MTNRYLSANAFRTALEERLNRQARTQARSYGAEVIRLRRLVAFERLLARLFAGNDPPWLLKGGYSLEMRLRGAARATQDIDLTVPYPARLGTLNGNPLLVVHKLLQESAALDLGDWFVYRLGVASTELVAVPYGGARFPVEALLANRTFAAFHLSVSPRCSSG